MKRIYEHIAVVAVAVTGLVLASCDRQQPGAYEMTDGVPEVRYVRPVKFAASDSLMTGAYMDNQICLVGENLRSIYELWFNDQKAILNSSYITDNTLIVTVPGTIPGEVSDKIYMITASRDTVTYDFSVLIPGPTITSMSCEQTPAGETAVLYGDYFIDDPNVPLTITFADGVPVTDITEITKNAVTFVVPDGAEEGKISVETVYGEDESNFHYLDSRGIMFDFDGLTGLTNHGWHNRVITDEGGITGNYVQLGDGSTAMSEDGGWNDSQFAFEYWCGSWDTPQNVTSGDGIALNNLVDFTDFKNMALKFELCVPSASPWSAGALQIAFGGFDKVTLSGNPIDGYDGTVAGANAYLFNGEQGDQGSFGRAIYRPWLTSSGVVPFDTGDEWITVTIPLSDFIYDRLGAVTSYVPSSPADFASLTFFVVGGGVNGTECTPVLMIDNIRAVSIR